jgi:hypothetical protein
MSMHYKTILMGLLERYPEIQNELRAKRLLLKTLNTYARELRNSHRAWKVCLSRIWPDKSESEIASEALELALREMERSFLAKTQPGESGPLSLEDAMAFIRGCNPLR